MICRLCDGLFGGLNLGLFGLRLGFVSDLSLGLGAGGLGFGRCFCGSVAVFRLRLGHSLDHGFVLVVSRLNVRLGFGFSGVGRCFVALGLFRRLGLGGFLVGNSLFGLADDRLHLDCCGRLCAFVGGNLVRMHVIGVVDVVLARHGRGRDHTGARRRSDEFLAQLIDSGLPGVVVSVIAGQRRGRFTALRGQHHVHDGTDEHKGRRERVDPDARDMGGQVAAHELDPEAAQAISGDIEREQPAVAQLEPAVGPQQ